MSPDIPRKTALGDGGANFGTFLLPNKKIPVAPQGLTQRRMNQFGGCITGRRPKSGPGTLEMSLNQVAERLERWFHQSYRYLGTMQTNECSATIEMRSISLTHFWIGASLMQSVSRSEEPSRPATPGHCSVSVSKPAGAGERLFAK
jgi:hypothetical protein